MFKLLKAVEKAKKKREGLNGNLSFDNPFENIHYSKTFVQNTSFDLLRANNIVASDIRNQNSQVFRTLRTNIAKSMRQHEHNTLAITSPNNGDGKSIISCNLAISLSMELNQTVLLVDLDLKNPEIAKYFGLDIKYGLSDYLSGKVTLSEIMINPGIERLVIIPGSGTVENSSELLSSPRMTSLFQELKNRYKSRFVLYDCPAILPTDDFLSCCSNIDSSLMVIGNGNNTKQDIIKSKKIMDNYNLLGCIVNNLPD